MAELIKRIAVIKREKEKIGNYAEKKIRKSVFLIQID
jgi:hypothetical protein